MAYTKPTGISDPISVVDAASGGAELFNVSRRAPPRSGNTRELTFFSENPSKDIDLLLMFNPPDTGKIYVDLFPVCWKVISFLAKGSQSAKVTYIAKTALLVPQVDSGNIVSASYAQHCETGQQCLLETNGSQNYLTPPEPGPAGLIECVNKTGSPADVGIGFFNDTSTPTKVEPTFVWNDIADKYTLAAQLTPRLQIYAVSDYKESELIRADIQSPIVLDQDLIALHPSTNWIVSIEDKSGDVVIKQAPEEEA